MERSRASAGSIILTLGLGLLALGIGLTIYNFRKTPNAQSYQKQEKFLKQLDAAEPRFEFGYGPVNLDLFRNSQAKGRAAENELLAYPVFENEVAEQIRKNLPPITPDLKSLKLADPILREIAASARQNKMRLRQVTVICLIVKQVGQGKAASVELDVDRIALAGAVEMYDATFITGDQDLGEDQLRRYRSKEARQTFSLGVMDTGDAMIVPLFIANLFESLDESVESRQITNGIAFIPLTIRYRTINQVERQISADPALSSPIYFEK